MIRNAVTLNLRGPIHNITLANFSAQFAPYNWDRATTVLSYWCFSHIINNIKLSCFEPINNV